MFATIKKVVAENAVTWDRNTWILMFTWELVILLSAGLISAAAGGTSWTGLWWVCALTVGPLTPLLVPRKTRAGAEKFFESEAVSTWVGVAFLCGLGWAYGGYAAVWLLPDQEWAYRWRYVMDDELKGATFAVAPRPHACEFMTAPVGSKHCYYLPDVALVRIRRAASGALVVSRDGGLTWHSAQPSYQRPSVSVNWRRVDD